MSDSFTEISKEEKTAQRSCRVAYTINNSQPVASTIIGDQPLFYMDYEGDFEEEGLFEDGDFSYLESELLDLQKEIDSLDKFSKKFSDDNYNIIETFLENKEDMTVPAAKADDRDIAPLIESLQASRLAAAYIECANEYNVTLNFSRHVETANYNRRNKKILINPDMNETDQLLLAARELRRHYQHRQGALIHPLMFHPDNAILVNRAQICDLIVSMIRIAWELQLDGNKGVWERIENSSMADLGRAFAREAYLDFRTINNGAAAAAVFESWFLSERCRAQDKILIQQMLTDYQGYVFDLEEATQNITPTLIAALGDMPFGKNYLAEHAVTIMNDPIFSDVRDRSNANFLWFIKFERSFRETEQGLQNDLHPNASDIRSDASQKTTQDEDYAFAQKTDTTTSADIITLYAGSDPASGKTSQKRLAKKPRDENGKGADIIYLRRWSGE